jgi:hypothetical protein
MPFEREGKLLVFGADAELRFRFDAFGKPTDEIVAPGDRHEIDLITRHARPSRPYLQRMSGSNVLS